LLIVLAALLAILALSTIGSDQARAAPGDDPPTPLFSMEFQNVPVDTLIYPTRNWQSMVTVPGTVSIENYRPEDVIIYLNATIDNGWFVSINPLMLHVSTTRLSMKHFKVFLHIPANTIGPSESVLQISAVAKIPSRTLTEVNISVNLHFLTNVDQILDSMASIVMVLDTDRVFTDTVRLNNLLDEPQEFHISALGEWADRIPDLDFSSIGITLNPMEQRNTNYLGHVEGELENGVYEVELALWTPDGEGGRTYILNRTVDMEVFTLTDDFFLSYVRLFLPITVITSIVAVGVVVIYLRMRRQRRLAILNEQYQAWNQNGYHSG
jgi:hypothetical protein